MVIVAEAVLDREQLDDLLEVLLQVPQLDDSDQRDEMVQELERILRRPVEALRFTESRHDLSALVNACSTCSGGLRTLAALLNQRYPGDATIRVSELVDQIAGEKILSPADREALADRLAGIPIGQIADAVTELVDGSALLSLELWRDLPAAIRMLERLPLPDDGIYQLLTFTDRLVQLVGPPKSAELRAWMDTVAGGLGVDRVRLGALRSAGEAGPSEPAAPIAPRQRRSDDAALIWGGVPIRNRNFSGRVALLERLGEALRTSSTASVLPQALHGMGGVGKTQLVIEYVYRHLNDYDLVWWIAAEQTSSVLASLTQLAERLGLATSEERQQTARTVLDALASAELSWLLVYDNADDPTTLEQYVPTTGGHVILTTRNHEWSRVGEAIEVDVFEREESIELLQRRTHDGPPDSRISTAEANELADKLGDLPLALEQAAAWYLATAMSIKEYIELLDSHMKELLSEGKPANYPLSVAAFVTFAVEQLRATAPEAAQLFELFAYLGGEPVPVALLRRGSDADVSEPMRTMLGSSIPTNRTVRDLARYGLAKVDPLQRVQVHRLVQRVLRDSLSPELAERTLHNAQQLLAKANPGDPDENPELQTQWDMGPHIEPAQMIGAQDYAVRQVVRHHARFLYITGDYENSLALARRAAEVWAKDSSDPQLGPNGEQTLIAQAQVANALRVLGRSEEAGAMARDAYERLESSLGSDHETTLITGNQVGADLRIAGRYSEALRFDQDSYERHLRRFGDADPYTLRARANLAVDFRMIGKFAEAYVHDQKVADHWEDVGANDPRALVAYMNVARDLYGMGAYARGLELLEQWRGKLQDRLGLRHSYVLLAGRTHAILLRKLGQLDEAEAIMRENRERVVRRFGESHEFGVAATVSLANVLRETGELDEALALIADALERYTEHFGARNPLTLVALVNEAIIRRARGEPGQARELDESAYAALVEVLGPDHPYAICAGVSLATDLAQAHEHRPAVDLSRNMLELGREAANEGSDARDGTDHPYLLMRQVNLSYDLRAVGERREADTLQTTALAGLREALGANHPDVRAAEAGKRLEGDIEALPT
jgi:tetratricopeptide (TPR) repeat protein